MGHRFLPFILRSRPGASIKLAGETAFPLQAARSRCRKPPLPGEKRANR